MKTKLILKIVLSLIIFSMIFSHMSYAVEAIIEEQNQEIEEVIEFKTEYDKTTNRVIAKIISNVELKDTKPSWKLSKDKLTYTKIFDSNTDYTTPVENINGKVTNVNIKITEIRKFEIQVKLEHNKALKQVTAKIISSIELKDTKPSWKLSKDKLTYTKVFDSNIDYSTPVEDMYGNQLIANIKINQIGKEKAEIKVKNEYNGATNQVTVQIISDMELKDTKPTWKLSEDKLTYTKTFTSNMTYTTPVEDINGNVIIANIQVTEVRKANIQVKNIYDEETNQVTVQIISDMELKDTKPTWELSKDKKIYTKVFTSNMKYTTPVEDKSGNVIIANINIKEIDEIPPEIIVEYKYNDDDSVTVYLKSNEQLKDNKPAWKLSEDKMYFEKNFKTEQNYSTSVQDLHGVSTNVNIEFKFRTNIYNQKDGSTIKVRYLYISRTKAIVEIISSVKMKDTKPSWKLSEDGYTYTKEFSDNNIYTTPIEDINGVKKDVDIIVNLFDNFLRGMDVSVHQGEINWAEVKNSGVIDFVILRCGYGQNSEAQDDKMFVRNVTECERLGIPYGVYLYSYALNVENALSEAEHVLRLIKGHNPEYGIWIDLEEDSYKISNGMPSNETFVDIAVTFCEKIKENGYNKVGIYANLQWWNNILNDSKLDKYDKWIAQWGNKCTYDKKYTMWQYSSTGMVNGIKGNVDMNIFYK